METVKCKMSDDQFVNAIKELYSQKRTLLAMDADRVAEGVQIAINIIQSLPSADRPQGEWIYRTDVGWHATRQCSLCGWMQSYSDTKYMGYRYNYCPHCGCRMKGADDE